MPNNYYDFTNTFIPGTTVRSDDVNNEYSAIESAFGNFPTPTDAINRGTVYLGTESGSGNVFDVALVDVRLAYQEGDRITFRATHANTGSSSINLDGLGGVTAVRPDDTLLQAGDIISGVYYEFIYDSAENQFQMFNQPASFLVDMDARVDWAEEWAINPEDTAVSAAAGGSGSDFSSLHWAAKSSASAGAALTSEGNASTSETNSANNVGYAQEWAIAVEDTPVSVAAGGDGASTFSALHWSAKAEGWAASVNLPAIGAGDAGKGLIVNPAETGYDFDTTIAHTDAATTFTSTFRIQNSAPVLGLYETDIADQNYDFQLNSGTLKLRKVQDGGAQIDIKISMTQDAQELALTNGDITYNGASLTAGGDLVDDTTPQLGGNLDVQSFNITGASASDTVRIRGGNNNAVNQFVVTDGGGCTIGGNTVWHAGNDGSGSGLDADLLDGLQASTANSVSTVAARDGSGDINCRLIRGEYTGVNTTAPYFVVKNAIGTGDNYHRNISLANARAQILSSGSIKQSTLSTATASQSSAIGGGSYVGITRTGGNYQLSGACGAAFVSDTALGAYTTSSSPNISVIGFQNLAGINGTVYYTHRYVQASPPYNLGDGEVPMFIQLLVDKATGEVVGHSVAPDPVWANNGPTNTRPDLYNGDGTGFIRRREGASKALVQRAIRGDVSAMEEVRRLPIISVEVDDSIKNADMNVVPHCWEGIDLSKFRVVTVDPMGAICRLALDLMETENDAYMEFAGLLGPEVFSDYFILDSSPLQRNAPILAPAATVRWKNTAGR